MRPGVCGVTALTGTLLLLFPALAQDFPTLPPGIAHISAMKGKVLVRHADGGNQEPAKLNTPLASGDVIITEPGARADIDLDSAHAFRLEGSGEVRLEKSEYERYQIALDKGGIIYRVSGQSAAIAAVDTPSVSAAPTRQGVYRISLSGNGESEIRADEGEIMAYAPTGSIWVNEGERLRARGSSLDPEFRVYRRSRIWRRLAQLLGNIQIAADIGSSGGSDDSSRKKSADDSGRSAARATPHPSRTPTEPLRSDSAHREGAVSHGAHPVEAAHGSGSSHTSSSTHGSSSSHTSSPTHTDSSSHASSSGGGSSGSSHSSSAPAASSSSSSSSSTGSRGK